MSKEITHRDYEYLFKNNIQLNEINMKFKFWPNRPCKHQYRENDIILSSISRSRQKSELYTEEEKKKYLQHIDCFCVHCGEKLPEDEYKKCVCKNPVSDIEDSSICGNCGDNL